jgi:tryptophan synthase alpha chain
VLGVTGTRSATEQAVREAVARLKQHTELPVGVGFGIKTPEQAAAVARVADAAVVGSAIVDRVKANLDANGKARPGLVADVHRLVGELAAGVRGARK